ncbi:MAG: sterol desaturase family protein [Bacteroidales bacterium]|nr:sterol desaturase family protein [Bacteroidales bacterium]
MEWYFVILLVAVVFVFMEFVAWFTHKYVMHGFLWVLHKDHHIRDGRKYEWNDLFALFFSIPSIILIYLGYSEFDYRFWIGVGIFSYGVAYFLFHDVYVHQRVKMLSGVSNRYLRATVRAHRDHHKPRFYANYGFLLAPVKYYIEEFRKKG